MEMYSWYLRDTAFTYLARGSEKCTWNGLNPILAGAITSIKRVGERRKLLAVRFIDRKQALCDKNLKLRASKFTILHHQIGSYKFTGFLIGCRHSSLPVQYMYIMPSHVEPHILCMRVSVCLYVCLCLFSCMCAHHYIPVCALHASVYIFISLCLIASLFLCLCERVHSFMRVWPCSQWPVAFSLDSHEVGKWPLICPAFSPSPY